MINSTLFDEFVIAHTLGWWGKAVIIRNQPMLWLLSVGFELMELTFQHMLPNFNECWWDSWLLDVAICNFIGLLAGMATVRWGTCCPACSAEHGVLCEHLKQLSNLTSTKAGGALGSCTWPSAESWACLLAWPP